MYIRRLLPSPKTLECNMMPANTGCDAAGAQRKVHLCRSLKQIKELVIEVVDDEEGKA